MPWEGSTGSIQEAPQSMNSRPHRGTNVHNTVPIAKVERTGAVTSMCLGIVKLYMVQVYPTQVLEPREISHNVDHSVQALMLEDYCQSGNSMCL